jgi:hypothetical protein
VGFLLPELKISSVAGLLFFSYAPRPRRFFEHRSISRIWCHPGTTFYRVPILEQPLPNLHSALYETAYNGIVSVAPECMRDRD